MTRREKRETLEDGADYKSPAFSYAPLFADRGGNNHFINLISLFLCLYAKLLNHVWTNQAAGGGTMQRTNETITTFS